jgi:RNA polymerase sigma-70 factor (ECF subfamily)
VDDWTEWALAAAAGDDGALHALVEQSRPQVHRLCAHLGDPASAEDLTQDTYVRMVRSLPTYRGDAPFRVWLFAIARRTVADDIAARQRRRGLDQLLRERTVLQRGDHADEAALRALLDGLEPDRREAFVLTQVLGFSYADAASIGDCPIGTIRSRVARAREDLVAAYDADGRTA